MATSTKALEMSADLADELRKRMASTLLITPTFDSDLNPVLTISQDATPATGEKVIVIRTKPQEWDLALDTLGLANGKYAQHVIQICTEKNYEATTDNVLDILGPAELLPCLLTVGKRGTRVEWYRSDNGTVPATGQMVASKLAAAYDFNQYWGANASS